MVLVGIRIKVLDCQSVEIRDAVVDRHDYLVDALFQDGRFEVVETLSIGRTEGATVVVAAHGLDSVNDALTEQPEKVLRDHVLLLGCLAVDVVGSHGEGLPLRPGDGADGLPGNCALVDIGDCVFAPLYLSDQV